MCRAIQIGHKTLRGLGMWMFRRLQTFQTQPQLKIKNDEISFLVDRNLIEHKQHQHVSRQFGLSLNNSFFFFKNQND